jgi:hypothetical protein
MSIRAPFAILLSTAVLLALGVAAGVAWSQTGDPFWIHSFFSYAGAPFLVACSFVGSWASLECWKQFSPGDLLRPAWLLITLSALAQLVGGIVTHLFGNHSLLSPFVLFHIARNDVLIGRAAECGRLFSPLYMGFLAIGLFYVLKACRQNAIVGRFRRVDILLLIIVAAYTANFLATAVLVQQQSVHKDVAEKILDWTSDPLLCILLLEASLIRRSIGNMGWGLIARCWVSFTAAIFLTSVGDIGLWAWWKGYLPQLLEIASWYVWFLASAAFALGPCYQLQALVYATSRGRVETLVTSRGPLQNAV